MDFETKFYSAGIPLAATLHVPDDGLVGQPEGAYRVPDSFKNAANKYPMVILCHGQTRFRNDGLDVLAQRLGENGFASLRFDHRGSGSEAVNRYRLRPAEEMPFDTRCAIYYCESLYFIDRNRIGISGISMGGVMSIITAATDSRIKSIAAMGTPTDCGYHARQRWREDIFELFREDARINAATGHSRIVHTGYNFVTQKVEDPNGAARTMMDSLMFPGNNPYNSMESIFNLVEYVAMDYIGRVNCPTFIMHGEEDNLLPAWEAENLYNGLPESNKNKRIKFYPHVGHNIPVDDNREIVFKDIVDWFLETL